MIRSVEDVVIVTFLSVTTPKGFWLLNTTLEKNIPPPLVLIFVVRIKYILSLFGSGIIILDWLFSISAFSPSPFSIISWFLFQTV